MATGFLPYFVLGYLLGEIELSRSRVILSAVIGTIGAVATVIGTYLMTRSSGQYNGFFYDFVSLNVILASAAGFVLLRSLGETEAFASPRLQALTRTIAIGSFGVF